MSTVCRGLRRFGDFSMNKQPLKDHILGTTPQ